MVNKTGALAITLNIGPVGRQLIDFRAVASRPGGHFRHPEHARPAPTLAPAGCVAATRPQIQIFLIVCLMPIFCLMGWPCTIPLTNNCSWYGSVKSPASASFSLLRVRRIHAIRVGFREHRMAQPTIT